MSQILAVTLNTFREAIRDKVLYGIVFFAILIILFSLVLGELSLHEEKRITIDLGLSGISLFSVIIAIFLGVTLVKKEVEKRTVFYLLTKPITRPQFIIGKFLGMLWTILVQILLMFSALFVVLAIQAEVKTSLIVISLGFLVLIWIILFFILKFPTHIWISLFSIVAILTTTYLAKGYINISSIIKAGILCFCEISIITALAIMFSTIATPLMSGIITFGIFMVGRNIQNLELLAQKVHSESTKLLLKLIVTIFPNLYLFYPSGAMLEAKHFSIHGEFVAWRLVGWDSFYALVYTVILLIISIILFKRKEFI